MDPHTEPPGLRSLQLIVGLLVIFEAVVVSFGGFFTLVWIVWDGWLTASVFALAAAALGSWPLLTGRWARGPAAALQVAGVIGVAVLNAWFAVSAGRNALEAFQERTTLGVPTGDAVQWLVILALAACLLAAIVAVVPLQRPARRVAVAAAAGVAALAVAATGSAVAVGVTGDRCGDFRLDGERWRAAAAENGDDAEQIAAAIVHCRVLARRTRSDVRRLLGTTRDMNGGTWTYPAGWVNDGIGPGDGQELLVHFGAEGRVRRTELLFPED